jgi:hypothetical protein
MPCSPTIISEKHPQQPTSYSRRSIRRSWVPTRSMVHPKYVHPHATSSHLCVVSNRNRRCVLLLTFV